MSVEKNETAIQALKIMYAVSSKKKKLTKTHYSKPYPKGIEAHYKTMLSNFFNPLVKFVNKFLQENSAALLRGDSKDIRCDVMPGGTFRTMVEQMEGWLSVYMPTVPEMQAGQNNVVFTGLGNIADSLKKYEDTQFQKQLQNGIGVQFQTNAPWWNGTKANWAQNNYSLITSNARNYVSQINTLAERAVVNGLSVKQLQEQIKKASSGLTDKKCRLLARDQIGKLQGQIAQAQMEEVGLEMYVWETSGDERVRGNPAGKYPQANPSHFLMDGLLCRWDDAGVFSNDGGKTWVNRPANAVKLHPGQDIQCRCIALVYMPELLFEVSAEPVESFELPAMSKASDANTEDITVPVPEIVHFTDEQLQQINQNVDNVLETVKDEKLRQYVKDSLNDIAVSNSNMKVLFYKIMGKMKSPYIKFGDKTRYGNKIIYFKNGVKLSNHRDIIHELGHAFSALMDRTGKNYSLEKTFISAVNKDYNALLQKYKTPEKLREYIIQVCSKNKSSFGGVSDIIGGIQKNPLSGFYGHNKEYWLEEENKVYKEAYADIFQMMFDKKSSRTVAHDLFPESYNIVRKQVAFVVKGEL